MGGSSPKAPKAPNPTKVAKAQANANQDAAKATQKINMISQTTPQGQVNYVRDRTAPGGYRAVTTLTPEAQAAYDIQQKFDTSSNQTAYDQLGRVKDILGTPIDLTNDALEGHLFDLATARAFPALQQKRDMLQTQLTNQGVQPGTEAWDKAMAELDQQQNDLVNQLMLTGRSQAMSEIVAPRNQSLKELQALLGLTGVDQQDHAPIPQEQINPADIGGYTYQGYAGAQNMYGQQMAQQNAIYGALGQAAGGLGSIAGGWLSPGGLWKGA